MVKISVSGVWDAIGVEVEVESVEAMGSGRGMGHATLERRGGNLADILSRHPSFAEPQLCKYVCSIHRHSD